MITSISAQTDSISDRLTWDKTKTNSIELNKILASPLDLQAFKKAKPMHSNSGGANKRNYYYQPPTKGFYYFYFLFNGHDANGPRITTYKKGKDIGGYMDSSEVFIQLACNTKDKDLGKLDLVGLPIKDLISKFGDNFLKSGENIIYQHHNTILIINGTYNVKWFKVTLLNKRFTHFEEISKAKDLLSYFNS